MKRVSSDYRLGGKTILLTGASGMLGSHFAGALYNAGANVILADLDYAGCLKLKNKIAKDSRRLFARELDITDEKSVKECLDAAIKKFKRLDGLVNNAVYRPTAESFTSRSLANFRKATDVNVNGNFLMTRETAKIMKKQKSGVIVKIGSIYGVVAHDPSIYPGAKEANAEYYAFHKGGLINFTRYLAALLGRHNIRVNALSPGGIFFDEDQRMRNKAFVSNFSKRVPLGRFARPEEICGPLIFLLSDESRYVTGHNLIVDGGWTAI